MRRPLHILWLCGSRVIGGAENTRLVLGRLLRRRGHRFEALCPPDSPLRPKLEAEGFAVHPAPRGGAWNLRAPAVVRRAFDELQPDVVTANVPDDWVRACLARRPGSALRLVLTRHMVVPLTAPVRWLALRRAAAVVAVSGAVRQALVERSGIPAERVHLILNPVRIPARASVPSAAERAKARERLGLDRAERLVGFFGGLDPAKGVGDVVTAVTRVDRALGRTYLLVCGPPASRRAAADPSRAACPSWLGQRVLYFGRIEDVATAYTACDVVAMATRSRLGEGLPATLLEAMACGTPAMGYATGGTAEAIGEHGRTGWLVRPEDVDDLTRGLMALLANRDLAQRLAAAGLARVRERFDPERAAGEYERLCCDLVEKAEG